MGFNTHNSLIHSTNKNENYMHGMSQFYTRPQWWWRLWKICHLYDRLHYMSDGTKYKTTFWGWMSKITYHILAAYFLTQTYSVFCLQLNTVTACYIETNTETTENIWINVQLHLFSEMTVQQTKIESKLRIRFCKITWIKLFMQYFCSTASLYQWVSVFYNLYMSQVYSIKHMLFHFFFAFKFDISYFTAFKNTIL